MACGSFSHFACLVVFVGSGLDAQEPVLEPGFEPVLGGKDLSGFRGDLSYWSVADGVITGRTTPENRLAKNTYLIWEGGQVGDFELRFSYRIVGGNSGVQYRSRDLGGDYAVAGYQADLETGPDHSGILYEEKGRGIVARRGQRVEYDAKGEQKELAPLGDAAVLQKSIRSEEWNEYVILARGPKLVHRINGKTMVEVIDRHPEHRAARGILAFQLHAGPPMLVQFKDIRIRHLEPSWIWATREVRDGQKCYFRHAFEVEGAVRRAELVMACDNQFEAWLNGRPVLAGKNWESPVHAIVTNQLVRGRNLLAVFGRNENGPAGLCGRLRLTLASGQVVEVVTGVDWLVAEKAPNGWRQLSFDASGWRRAVSFGTVAEQRGPWPDLLSPHQATRASKITAKKDFAVELLCSAQPGQGSWVSMTFDARGRIILSQQYGPLMRVTLPDHVEELPIEGPYRIRGAQGLLWAFDSLYVMANASVKQGGGLYRLRDTNADDRFDMVQLLAPHGPGGEHGAHGLVLGPDGMLYLMHGNMTDLPKGLSPNSPYRSYAEDVLLRREWDPNGHAVGVMAPGARVLRTDPDGRNWEIVAGGMRNPYDLAFNESGDLFTFDADMEWDIGLPWYRPTRVLHVVAGGEYGWRGGSAKWPTSYPDSLGAVVDTGESSPTGIEFGTASNFPPPYRKALFLGDWAKGRILVAHLRRRGISYEGKVEEFLSGKPLAITDLSFGRDGALYFITGGRRGQAGLYRVRYVGSEKPAGAMAKAGRARLLHPSVRELDDLWPELGSEDRFVRFMARVALEIHDPKLWRQRALSEKVPSVALASLLALARVGGRQDQDSLIARLCDLGASQLCKFEFLRIVTVSCCRNGQPGFGARRRLLETFNELYPSGDFQLDRELAPLLMFLEAADMVPRTLMQLAAAKTRAEQIAHAFLLRNLDIGWTAWQREQYFRWLAGAKTWEGGHSLGGYVKAIERRALANAPGGERDRLAKLSSPNKDASSTPGKAPPSQQKYTSWKLRDLLPQLGRVGRGRSFENGKKIFTATLCIQCHRFGAKGGGGGLGPDLTAVASRFNRRDLLTEILEPSKTISDQYESSVILKKDGGILVGRIVEKTKDELVLRLDPLKDERTKVKLSDIKSQLTSPFSIMPTALLNTLSAKQILDLLAFLESGGDPRHEVFSKK